MEESYKSENIRLPILDSTNWVEWIDSLEDVLRGKKLWKFATGEVAITEKNEDQDSRALAIVKSAVDREQRSFLLGIRTTQGAIEKLRSVHERPGFDRVRQLQMEFYGMTFQANVHYTASRLTHLQLEIAAANEEEKPTDSTKTAILIRCLPGSFESSIFALKAAGLGTMSFDDVVQRMTDVERQKDEGEQKLADEQLARVAATRATRPTNGKGYEGLRGITCHFCGKKGHKMFQCRKMKDAQAQLQEQEGEEEPSNLGEPEQTLYAENVAW